MGKRKGKKKNYDIKKIILYIVILAIIIIGERFLSKLSKTNGMDKVSASIQEPVFRKDGSLTFYTSDNKRIKTIDIEIAQTEEATAQGLMDRSSLDEEQGMLFIFPHSRKMAMWMKNTNIPLDMIFIRTDKTISEIVYNVPPLNENQIISAESVQYVLEVNAGFSSRNKITPEQRIDWLFE